MESLFELLTYQFVQRALIGGILVGIATAIVGSLAVLKRSSMVGDTIAHSSLAGIALGLLVDVNPLIAAGAVAGGIALLLPKLERAVKLPIDNILGFILPFFMAIGILILSTLPGYQPELMSYFFGSILTISWGNIFIVEAVTLGILVCTLLLREQLAATAFDEEYARISGVNTNALNIFYNIMLALTIVVGIQLVGIILLNALLVIPAATARLFARSLKDIFIFTPILSLISIVLGILLSLVINTPTGPTIAVLSGLLFLIVTIFKK